MKKTAILLLIVGLFLQSCAVIRFTEHGQEISEQKRVFFVAYGIAPINDNTFRLGPSYVTKQDITDWFITAVTGGIIYSHSVIPE